MRRWRIVLAGAAVAASTFVGITPAQAVPNLEAMSDNARCRYVTNEVRKGLHEPGEQNFNQLLNQIRNDFCGTLDD